jgi:hypothetical protein
MEIPQTSGLQLALAEAREDSRLKTAGRNGWATGWRLNPLPGPGLIKILEFEELDVA